MIRLIRRWLHEARCQVFGCHVSSDEPTPTPIKTMAEERMDRVEQRIDNLIVEIKGRDFLESVMTNQEGKW